MGRAANLRAKLAPAFREAVAPKTETPAPEALGLPGTVFLGIVFGAIFVGLLVLSQWLLTKWLGWQILLIFICLDGGLAFAGVWLWKGLVTKAKAEDASDPLSE